jgi:tetratricopeptide (TPR) repeat protein
MGTTVARRNQPPPRDLSRWAPCLVALATLLVFLPSIGNEFVNWDDDRNFLDNPHYRGLGPTQVRWAFDAFILGHYHPLTWLSSSLDYVLWGLNPTGYHFTNVAIHAATAVVVFFAFLALLQSALPGHARLTGAAVVGALVFAIHPLRVESVVWASERRDVLCGLFYSLTVLLYLKGKLRWALTVFAAALLSKVLAASLPIALLLLDAYPLRRRFTPRLLWEKAPFFALALSAGAFALTRTAGSIAGATADLGLYPDLRVALSLNALAFYISKTLLPWGLYAQYVRTLTPSATDLTVVLSASLVIALTATAVWQWKRRPWIAIAWAFYVITLLPVLSLLRLDRQQYVADHHSYFATLPMALLAGAAYLAGCSRNSKRTTVVSVAVLMALGVLSLKQAMTWSDSQTLWIRTAAAQPLSIVAHNNLGRVLLANNNPVAASASFQQAVALDPNYSQAHYNLGSLQMQQGDLASAEASLRTAVEQQPHFSQAQNALANCLLRQRRASEALPHYQQAVDTEPTYADAHYNFGVALEYLGEHPQAVEHYRQALALDRTNIDASNAIRRLQPSQ